MKKNPFQILDTSALYELSLAVGGSIDSLDEIADFLLFFKKKKRLSYVSLWIYDVNQAPANRNSRLIFSHPPEYVNGFEINLDKVNMEKLEEWEFYSLLASDKTGDMIPENLPPKGAIAYISLGNLGVLKIYDKERQEPFLESEFLQLKPILTNFSQAFTSYISHQKHVSEFNEQSYHAAKLKSLIDATLDGFIIFNTAGEITEWNHQAEVIFGWTKEEVVGKILGDIIIPSDYCETHKNMIRATMHPETPNLEKQRIEIVVLRKTGESFPIEFSLVPVEINDTYLFFGYIRDITQVRREEKKRQKLMAKLEEANRELNDFAHVVSHDLKAPLRAIRNLSDWISADYEDKLGEEGQQQFELLKSRVDRMKDLINGILEYSRMGRLNSEEKVVDLQQELEEVIKALDPPEHIHIKIVEKIPHVFINEVSIMQVFQNLISNAIKYNDKPSGLIEIGCKQAGKRMCFWVRDNGPGIAPKDRKRIFKIFETLENARTYESTGVGLAIVKKILSNYKGNIWLESNPGEGTTFFFTLPNKRIISQTELPVQA